MTCKTIRVYLDKFLECFTELKGKVTEESLASAYMGAQSLISTTVGSINLPIELQERGVYLATAHTWFLRNNPDIVANGKMTSASEGSVSASFATAPYKNWFEYYLSYTPYGVELLAILNQAQPLLPDKPCGTYPYYGVGFGYRR